MRVSRRALGCGAVGAVALAAAGCSEQRGADADPSRAAARTSPGARETAGPGRRPPQGAVRLDEVAMSQPGSLRGGTVSPDLLVTGAETIPASALRRIKQVSGVSALTAFSLARFYLDERQVSYAAVDPSEFRRFTPAGAAELQAIWNRVAGGEMAIRDELGKKLQDDTGYVQMGNDHGSPLAHIGAYAPLVSRYPNIPVIDAVVNQKWASRLKMREGNAVLISTGEMAPRRVKKRLSALLGKDSTVQVLAVDLDLDAVQTAVLTGGSVSSELGTVRYTANANGTVNLQPAWVKQYIRTEPMPIVGNVTGNKIMLPQLRAALDEVVARGLADKIHPSQYGGCFVPRFIAGTKSLSFHTFGTAIDFNVPENLRGTVGQMDRTVVAIFKKWGFGWGGDWSYTDPMHFELHRLVKAK